MTGVSQQVDTRSGVVLDYVRRYLAETSMSLSKYAQVVVEVYHVRVPDPKQRVMQFHESADAVADYSANDQLIRRLVSERVNFPADLEESFVLALAEPYQSECLQALAERYCCLAVKIPVAESCEDTANLSRILKETGDVMSSLGPIFANGKIDADDAPHAKFALQQLNEAMAEMIQMSMRLNKILPDTAVSNVAQIGVKHA